MITNPLDRAGAVVDGVFRKLLDKAAFQKAVYPGLSEDQRRGAPQSLQQLLESPLYSKVGLIHSLVPWLIRSLSSSSLT